MIVASLVSLRELELSVSEALKPRGQPRLLATPTYSGYWNPSQPEKQVINLKTILRTSLLEGLRRGEVCGYWALITAGHVIHDMDRAAERKALLAARLIDGFGADARFRNSR